MDLVQRWKEMNLQQLVRPLTFRLRSSRDQMSRLLVQEALLALGK